MGLDLGQKFRNINKKRVAIIVTVLFVAAICVVCGWEYYQMKHFQSDVIRPAQSEPDIRGSMLLRENVPNANQEPTLKPSQYNIGIAYEKAMKEKKPVIVLFYADWCHFCIKFMPTYQSLSKIYKNEYNFSKINVEDPHYEKLVNEVGITGFPTVFIIDPKYDNRVLLSNSTFGDMRRMRVELDRFLRIRKLLDSKKHQI